MSVMFWMIMFYVLYVIFLIVEIWFYFRDDLVKQAEEGGLRGLVGKIASLQFLNISFLKFDRETNKQFAKAIGFATVVTAIIAHSNLGALFAVNYLPFWHGALLPIYFILSAIVSGASLTILAAVLADWIKGSRITGERYEALQMLRFILGFSLVVTVFFTAWKIIIKAYPTAGWFSNEAVSVFLTGPYAFNFWIIEVFIGLLIPIAILASPAGRSIDGLFVAAFLTVVGIFFLRIDLVMGGQVLKLISGIGVPAMSVHPFEIMAASGFLALMVLLYYVLYRVLPMEG
jgi:molybdopterin-containing oxidoreductase family membrane subunit